VLWLMPLWLTCYYLAFVAFAFVARCLRSADEDKSEAQRGVSESSTASELPVVAMLLLSVEATCRAALLTHLFIKKTQF
jgi:hypothetical protein